MLRSLSSLFALYILTPGRRIFALGQVRKLAEAGGFDELLKDIDAAVSHDRHVLDLDAARRDPTKPPPVRKWDSKVDRGLGMIENLASHYADDEPSAGPATSLLATCFPNGLKYHVHLPFIEQAAENERVLAILEGETHAKWLEAHGFRPLIDKLRKHHDIFSAALKIREGVDSRPSWDEVKAARATGQERYLQIVARILVDFVGDLDTRDKLLAPILHQDDLVQAYRRQRRNLVEVDPDSGEPLAEGEGEEGEVKVKDEAESEAEGEAKADA